jgi:uncharacterized membrane protein YeaQ/YmgE (transglycosylase-associated protein family)
MVRRREGAWPGGTTKEVETLEWLAWIVVGAIAGWLAGLLVKGDESLGVIGHVLLGLVGALLGGWVVSQVTGNDPMDGVFDISTIVTAVIGAVVLVVLVSMIMGRRRTGSGPV